MCKILNKTLDSPDGQIIRENTFRYILLHVFYFDNKNPQSL